MMYEILCQRLKKLRTDNDYSQAKLANILHVAQQTVDAWEQGRGQPSAEMLVRLSNLYDVSVDYLVGKCANFN